MRSRDRARAEANQRAMAGISQAPRKHKTGRKPAKKQATPQQIAFRDYSAAGYSPEEAKRLAYG